MKTKIKINIASKTIIIVAVFFVLSLLVILISRGTLQKFSDDIDNMASLNYYESFITNANVAQLAFVLSSSHGEEPNSWYRQDYEFQNMFGYNILKSLKNNINDSDDYVFDQQRALNNQLEYDRVGAEYIAQVDLRNYYQKELVNCAEDIFASNQISKSVKEEVKSLLLAFVFLQMERNDHQYDEYNKAVQSFESLLYKQTGITKKKLLTFYDTHQKLREVNNVNSTIFYNVLSKWDQSRIYPSQLKIAIQNQIGVIHNRINNLFLVIVVFLILMSALIAYYFITNISKGVKGNIAITDEVSKGNLDFILPDAIQRRDDEFNKIGYALLNMGLKLKRVVESIYVNISEIKSRSEQLHTISNSIASEANKQASSIEEISSSMEEMLSNIEQTSQNTAETNAIINTLSSEIKDVVTVSQQSANSISDAMEKISIVNDIAFQTNILALNAAVEAARAGEAGRGFSVVANEVSKLAEKSKVAAGEMNELLRHSVEVSASSVEKLELMVPEVLRSGEMMNNIVASSNELVSGANMVNQSIVELNRISQESIVVAEKLANESNDLDSMSLSIVDQVKFFKQEA
nr:methyl-accepting chemotaxis protein [uncultured Carboxylicivirga sp.]